jgi:hypothetical protein
MSKWLAKFPAFDKAVDRFGYWGGFITAVYTAVTGLFSYVSPVAQYGWAVVALAGIAATCIIVLVASAFLVAARYFNPVKPTSDNPRDPLEVAPEVKAPLEPLARKPEQDEVSKDTHNELVWFCVDYLLPACEAQIALQKRMIKEFTKSGYVEMYAWRGAVDHYRSFGFGSASKNYQLDSLKIDRLFPLMRLWNA